MLELCVRRNHNLFPHQILRALDARVLQTGIDVRVSLYDYGDGNDGIAPGSGCQESIATDDGSLGRAGFVDQAFEHWLDQAGLGAEDLVVYACGPEAMMQAVAEICLLREIECQLALERHMACGMGTCQSCVVKIRDGSDRGWSFKLCCTDGPVFDARDVVWD